MSELAQQLVDALETVENTAESVGKLTGLLKKGLELYQGDGAKLSSGLILADGKTPMDFLLQNTAEIWSQQDPQTRRGLLEPVRSNSRDTGNQLVTSLMKQALLLAKLGGPVTELGVTLGAIITNQFKIMEQLDKMQIQLAAIEAKLDEQTLTKARAGLQHLLAAANVENPENKKVYNQNASIIFNELISLDQNSITRGTSGTVSNQSLIALGYWGMHLVMALQGETLESLVRVYQCSELYPIEGVLVMPAAYFKKDYKGMIGTAKFELEAAEKNLPSAIKNEQNEEFKRGAEFVGGLLGVVGGFVTAVITRNPAALNISRGSNVILNDANQRQIDKSNSLHLISMRNTRQALLTQLSGEVKLESKERLQKLEKIKLADLRQYTAI